MKLARLLTLSLGLVTAALVGCAAPADEDVGDAEVASSAASAGTGYVLEDAELGKVYFRLAKSGTRFSGHAFQEMPQGVGAAARMEVTGKASGTSREIELSHFWGAKVKFKLQAGAAGELSGTRDGSNIPVAVKLAPIPADRSEPLRLSYGLYKDEAGCQLRANGVELFGMKDPAREAALNAAIRKSLAAAEKECKQGTTAVLGGAYVGIVNDELQTWSASYDIERGSSYLRFGAQRISQYADGSNIVLWGEVLAPGAANEAKLGQLVEQAVERTIGRGLIEVIGQTRKDELKQKMKDRAASGALATDFYVGSRGLAFGTQDFDPRVRSIVVPWADLETAGILATSGKAKSAWQ